MPVRQTMPAGSCSRPWAAPARPASSASPASLRGGRDLRVDAEALNRELVLENDVVFGSVNANAGHYRAAVEALARADAGWLARLMTRRVPLSDWSSALRAEEDDVKVVIDLAG